VLLYYAFYLAKVESSVLSQVPKAILRKIFIDSLSLLTVSLPKGYSDNIFQKFLGLYTCNVSFCLHVKVYIVTDIPKKKLGKRK
jgi:hypothetical protein